MEESANIIQNSTRSHLAMKQWAINYTAKQIIL